jgi:hypothetical protein
MINLTIKIGVVWISIAIFRYALKMYRSERALAEWHILRWSVSLVCGAVVASAGEYGLSRGWMPALLHLIYDAIINGFILLAIYHGTAFTIEWTQVDRKLARKDSVRRWLGIGGILMMGLYVPYRFELQRLFYYPYNGIRGLLFFLFIGYSIVNYYRQAKATVHTLTRQRMYLLMSACCVCLLYPFTVHPSFEQMAVRPNLVVSLCGGTLFYLGYVTPAWFRSLLGRFGPKLSDEFLRSNLILSSVIINFFNERPGGRFLLERLLKQFGRQLSMPKRQVELLVLASYLVESGRLEDTFKPAVDTQSFDGLRRDSDGEDSLILLHQRSASFTAQLLGLREIGQVIHHIDERWDGRGSPDALSGRGIPYESRVLSLIDGFTFELFFHQDANVALEAVKTDEGRFDPHLIGALEEMIAHVPDIAINDSNRMDSGLHS